MTGCGSLYQSRDTLPYPRRVVAQRHRPRQADVWPVLRNQPLDAVFTVSVAAIAMDRDDSVRVVFQEERHQKALRDYSKSAARVASYCPVIYSADGKKAPAEHGVATPECRQSGG